MLMANLRGAMKSREKRLERTPSMATIGRDSMLYRGSLVIIMRSSGEGATRKRRRKRVNCGTRPDLQTRLTDPRNLTFRLYVPIICTNFDIN